MNSGKQRKLNMGIIGSMNFNLAPHAGAGKSNFPVFHEKVEILWKFAKLLKILEIFINCMQNIKGEISYRGSVVTCRN